MSEKRVDGVIGATADLHVRSDREQSRQHFSSFIEACVNSPAEIVVLDGDIFDQKATHSDIGFVRDGIFQLVEAGKQVVVVHGNHEDRLTKEKQARLSQSAFEDVEFQGRVHVLENERIVLPLQDGRHVAIVGVSCVLTPEEQKWVNSLPGEQQAAAMQKKLEQRYAEEFEKNMEHTRREGIATLVVFHNPPIYESYGNALKGSEGLVRPGRFVDAMDPEIIFAIIHGHLHGYPFEGIPYTHTSTRIPVYNVARKVAGGTVFLDAPGNVRSNGNRRGEV